MRVFQSGSFRMRTQRLSPSEKRILDDQIRDVLKNPSIGEQKKGDLRGVFVHKFKLKSIQYLLAYRVVDDDLELIMLGPHENYHRDLAKYLKTR